MKKVEKKLCKIVGQDTVLSCEQLLSPEEGWQVGRDLLASMLYCTQPLRTINYPHLLWSEYDKGQTVGGCYVFESCQLCVSA